MRAHDLAHDGTSEACTAGVIAARPPKPFKHLYAQCGRDPWLLIYDAHAA